jgi:hypothetical protein
MNGNMTYGTGVGMLIGFQKGSCDATITNNYIANTGGPLYLTKNATFGDVKITGNTFMSAPNPNADGGPAPIFNSTNYPSNTYLTGFPSSGKQFFYRPNQFEKGRGFAVVYNWDGSADLTIDLDQMGGFAGEKYQVHSMFAPNPYTDAPIATGTCGDPCGTISVPATTATRVRPYGLRSDGATPLPIHPDTGPAFNVYILYPDWDAPAPTSHR